ERRREGRFMQARLEPPPERALEPGIARPTGRIVKVAVLPLGRAGVARRGRAAPTTEWSSEQQREEQSMHSSILIGGLLARQPNAVSSISRARNEPEK